MIAVLSHCNEAIHAKVMVNIVWQGRPIMKIVYKPESDTDSLNSEEKALYDELQRELMDLRRNMRHKENENAKQVSPCCQWYWFLDAGHFICW